MPFRLSRGLCCKVQYLCCMPLSPLAPYHVPIDVNPYLSLDRPLCQYFCPPEVMGSFLYFSLCCNQSYKLSHFHLGVTLPPQCLLYDFYLVLGVGRVTDRDASVLARLLASTCILNSVTQFLDVAISIGTPNVSVGIIPNVTD